METREPVGSLYCLDTDLTVRKVLDKVTVSNGLAWSPDNTKMYYIDTATRKVVSFDYDLSSGNIKNKREVISIPEDTGKPDGMTIDEDGMLWIAHWGGYRVSRWNPKTGQLLQKVSVPAAQTSSCVFGGQNRSELFITTARTGLDQEELKKYPYSGGLFRVKTGVRGCPTYKFKG